MPDHAQWWVFCSAWSVTGLPSLIQQPLPGPEPLLPLFINPSSLSLPGPFTHHLGILTATSVILSSLLSLQPLTTYSHILFSFPPSVRARSLSYLSLPYSTNHKVLSCPENSTPSHLIQGSGFWHPDMLFPTTEDLA